MKRATVIFIVIITVVLPFKEVDSSTPEIKGIASWYSQSDPGILETTANMEQFDDSQLTCAIWGVPFNSILKVTNVKNGKYIFVRVNDRGPAKRLNRVIDLTKRAFSEIGGLEDGLIEVYIEIV